MADGVTLLSRFISRSWFEVLGSQMLQLVYLSGLDILRNDENVSIFVGGRILVNSIRLFEILWEHAAIDKTR